MLSFVCLAILPGIGYRLRRKLLLLQRLYLPASVIAGLLGRLLPRAADPGHRTPAAETFACKQLLTNFL